MAGFTIEAEVVRAGRATGNSRAAIVDADGKVRATATGMHVAVSPTPLFPATLDNSGAVTPRLAEAVPGEFPIGGRPRPPRLPPRRRDALPAGRGQRARRDDGVDAHHPPAARRGAVAVPADQPAVRLRQRVRPPRRPRPGAVRQHRPRHRPAPRSGRRVDGQPRRWRTGSRPASVWPMPCCSTTRGRSAGRCRRCCCGRSGEAMTVTTSVLAAVAGRRRRARPRARRPRRHRLVRHRLDGSLPRRGGARRPSGRHGAGRRRAAGVCRRRRRGRPPGRQHRARRRRRAPAATDGRAVDPPPRRGSARSTPAPCRSRPGPA